MTREYKIRLKGDKPIALAVNGKVVLGHDIAFDKEIWIANRPESQAVLVAVDYFQSKERSRRTFRDVTRTTRADLKFAMKNDATVQMLSRNYNLKESVVKECLRT